MPDDIAHSPQLAQASGGGAAPIGRVDTVAGTVTAQHVDGTTVTLTQGAPVFAKDVIVSQAGAKVALVFADKTTFALGESGQMKLDEMVYNPAGKDGKLGLSVLKGAFAFATGDIAATEANAMTVKTPVGTIGIRGTSVAGHVHPGGSSFAALPDPSGKPSIIAFTNGAGTQVLTENTQIAVQSFFTPPGAPTPTTGADLGEAGQLSFIANTIASTVNPGGSGSGGSTGGPTTPAPAHGPTGGEGGDHTPTIHVTNGSGTDASALQQAYNFEAAKLFAFSNDLSFAQQQVLLQPTTHIPQDHTIFTSPPPPPSSGFIGTLGVDVFNGTPASERFDFVQVKNSLQAGDIIHSGGGADTLVATFDQAVSLTNVTIDGVSRIEVTFASGANSVDATGITGGAASKFVALGAGALTLTHLQTNFDGSVLTQGENISASAGGIVIATGSGNDTITTAAAGSGSAAAGFGGGLAMDAAVAHAAVTGATIPGTVVSGGAGANEMHGGAADTVDYSSAPNSIIVNLATGQVLDNGYGQVDAIPGFGGVSGSANGTSNTVYLGADQFAHVSNIQVVHGDSVIGGDVLLLDAATPAITIDNVNVIVGSGGNDNITITSLAPGGLVGNAAGNASMPAASGPEFAATGGGGSDVLTFVNATNSDSTTGAIQVDNFATVHFLNSDDPTGSSQNTVLLTGVPVTGTSIDFGPSTHTGDQLEIQGSGETFVTVNGAEGIVGDPGANYHVTVQGDVTPFSYVSLYGTTDFVLFDTPSAVTANVFSNGTAFVFGSQLGDNLTINGADGVVFRGGAGDDTISSGSDHITIAGGDGNNLLLGSGQPDAFVSYADSSSPVIVELSAATVSHGAFTDTVSGFDGAIGSTGDDTFLVDDNTSTSYAFAGGGGNDHVVLGLNSDVTVYNVADVHTSGACGGSFTYVTAMSLTSSETFDLSNGGQTFLTFDLTDSHALTIFDLSGKGGSGNVAINGVNSIYLEGAGQYEVVLTGNTFFSLSTIDATQLTGGGSMLFVDNVGCQFFTVVSGAAADTMFGDPTDLLDYSGGPGPVSLVITGYDSVNGGVDGVGTGGWAAGDQFFHFGSIEADAKAGSSLVITASPSLSSGDNLEVHLGGDATIHGSLSTANCGAFVDISGFTSVTYLGTDNVHMYGDPDFIGISVTHETMIGGSGNDTIETGGLPTEFVDGNGTGASVMTDHNALYLPDEGSVQVSITTLDDNQGGIVDGTAVGNGSVTFHHFYEVSSDFGVGSELDVDVGSPVTLTIDNQDPTGDASGSGGITTGATTTGNFAFENFQYLSGPAGSTIEIGTAAGVASVDLMNGVINGANSAATYISGFENVKNDVGYSMALIGDDNANRLTAGSAGDTVTGNGGADTLDAGAGYDTFVYHAASDSFSALSTGADSHTDLINNFIDSQSIVDLSPLAPSGFYGGSDTAANRGTGATLSAVFGGEAAGQVDFAVVNGDTYIHMAGASGGYSTSDLLIHLQGVHTLNATNLHVGPPP